MHSTGRFGRGVVVIAGGTVCAAAFLRGDWLLGPFAGCLYAALAGLLVTLAARARRSGGRPSLFQLACVGALALPLGLVLAFPAAVNSDLQHIIDKHATERAARRELAALFASDPAFAGLSVSAVHLKVVNLIIKGRFAGDDEFRRLRARVVAECLTAAGCVIHWDVTLRDTGRRVDGTDRELFRE